MVKKRLIASLIWRNGMIVQSIGFKHTNVIGNAITAVEFFNMWAIDEIVIVNASRTEDYNGDFFEIVKKLSSRCFVPLSVGGWVKSVEDVRKLLLCGADKVIINTEAFSNHSLVQEASKMFGEQCVVVSIDVKRKDKTEELDEMQQMQHEVFIDRGRKPTGIIVEDWALKAQELGAGEIFLTSIDNDGNRKGYDLDLMKKVSSIMKIPIIAFGGVGSWQDFVDGIEKGKVDAVAAGNIFHYTEQSTKMAKEYMLEKDIDTRKTFFYKINSPRNPEYNVFGYK